MDRLGLKLYCLTVYRDRGGMAGSVYMSRVVNIIV